MRVPANPGSSKPVFIGIETGWNSNFTDCEALIDKVKNYTNLFIIASPLILNDEALLNQTCDYAYLSGMYFMPAYYQKTNAPTNGISNPYIPSSWFFSAKERYGDHLLGIYFYDEPSGSQLDQSKTIPNPVLSTNQANSYSDYANYDFWLWNHGDNGVQAVANFTHSLNSTTLTSDYGLYWFDYELGYDTVLAQFGWNNSRQLQVALTRGAAAVQNKNWGAIITWTYNRPPYLESNTQLYHDMVFAYDSGANYIAVYDSSQNYTSTTLNDDYFNELKNFWNYVQHNSDKHGSLKADIAVVLPEDYGFGFRSPDDGVWQYHQADNWTQKLYTDIANLANQNDSRIDVMYGGQEIQSLIQTKYSRILYWPNDFEANTNYPVININNNLGYSTIQDAISSYATYEGHMILIKPGTYLENIVITKPVSLISQNKDSTIIEGAGTGNLSVLTIACDNVTLTGFTIQNDGNYSALTGTGITLENAHNCTITNNLIRHNYDGLVLADSSGNLLKNNELSDNVHNLILVNSPNNNIDRTNTVDEKPFTIK